MTREEFQGLHIGSRIRNKIEPNWTGRVVEIRGYVFNHEVVIQNLNGRTYSVDIKNRDNWELAEE